MNVSPTITYRKFLLVSRSRLESEDVSVALVAVVALPEVAGVCHEFILEVHVPVLVVIVELGVFAGGHATNVDDAVVLLHRHVLDGSHCVGRQLL